MDMEEFLSTAEATCKVEIGSPTHGTDEDDELDDENQKYQRQAYAQQSGEDIFSTGSPTRQQHDKVRITLLERETKYFRERLLAADKESSIILAQLKLITDYMNSEFDVNIINTNSDPYKKWIDHYNISKITRLAEAISGLKKTDDNPDPQQPARSLRKCRVDFKKLVDDSDNYDEQNDHDDDNEYVLPDVPDLSNDFEGIDELELETAIEEDEVSGLQYDISPRANLNDDDFNSSCKSEQTHHGRPRLSVWNNFITIRNSTNKIISNLCKICNNEVSPRSSRMNEHLQKCMRKSSRSKGKKQSFTSKQRGNASLGRNSTTQRRKVAKNSESGFASSNENNCRTTASDKKANSVGGRKRSSVWSNFVLVEEENQASASARCKICNKLVSPRSERLNGHMARHHSGGQESTNYDDEGQDESSTNSESNQELTQAVGDSRTAELVRHTRNSEKGNGTTPNSVKRSKPASSGRKRSSIWSNFRHIPQENQPLGSAECKLCKKLVSPRLERLNGHMIRYHGVGQEEENTDSSQEAMEIEDDSNSLDSITDLEKRVLESSNEANQPKHNEMGELDLPTLNATEQGKRKRQYVWKFFKVTIDPETHKITSNICNNCHAQVSPRCSRLRQHLMKCLKSKAKLFRLVSTKLAKDRQKKKERLIKQRSQRQPRPKTTVQPTKNPIIIHDFNDLTGIEPKDGPGRRKMKVWSYYITMRDPTTKKVTSNVCKSCNREISPKAYRVRRHLAKCLGIDCGDNWDDNEAAKPIRIRKCSKETQRKKEELMTHFNIRPKVPEDIDAAIESSIKPRDTTIATCKLCALVLASRVKNLVDHLVLCKPQIADEYKSLIQAERIRDTVQCEECGKFLAGSLSNHMLTHTNIFPNRCQYCHKAFRRKHQLKFHILTVHKGVKAPPRKRRIYNHSASISRSASQQNLKDSILPTTSEVSNAVVEQGSRESAVFEINPAIVTWREFAS